MVGEEFSKENTSTTGGEEQGREGGSPGEDKEMADEENGEVITRGNVT